MSSSGNRHLHEFPSESSRYEQEIKLRKKPYSQGINHAPWTYPVPAVTPHVHPSALPVISLLHIRRRESLNHARAIHKPCPEDAVRVREHAVLQTDDDELTSAEARPDQATDVLGVGEIESGVDFVENVHGCWGVLEQREDKGEGDEGSRGIVSLKLRMLMGRWETYL